MIFFSKLRPGTTQLRAGFGLIELLVSISIMVLVTSVVLARHSAFSGTVLLKSQAYEIALRMREIQLSAVSVASSSVAVRSQYGVRFSSAVVDNGQYAVFATPLPATTNFYSNSIYSLVGAPGLLDQRFVIKTISLDCTLGSATTTGVIILFKRPNYDAEFRNQNGGDLGCVTEAVSLRIGPRGSLITDAASDRLVTVTKAGQISVD